MDSNKISLILTLKKSEIVLFTLSNEVENAFSGLLVLNNIVLFSNLIELASSKDVIFRD